MGSKRQSSVEDDAIVAKHEDVSNLVKTAVELDARHALVELNGYFSGSLLKQPVPNLSK
jgi:hypothetical protein